MVCPIMGPEVPPMSLPKPGKACAAYNRAAGKTLQGRNAAGEYSVKTPWRRKPRKAKNPIQFR